MNATNNRKGRQPNVNLKISLAELAKLNKQPMLSPINILKDLVLIDKTEVTPRSREDVLLDLQALPDGADPTTVAMTTVTGVQVKVGDLLIDGKKLNNELGVDFDDEVDLILHKVMGPATEAFQANLRSYLMGFAVKPTSETKEEEKAETEV